MKTLSLEELESKLNKKLHSGFKTEFSVPEKKCIGKCDREVITKIEDKHLMCCYGCKRILEI